MGVVQKDAIRTTIISYVGLVLGYINKGVLFILLLTTEQIGLVNLLLSVGLLFAQLANLGLVNSVGRFFPFFRNVEKDHYGFLLKALKVATGGAMFYLIITLLLKSNIITLYSEKSSLFVNYFYWIIPIGVAYVLFLVLEVFMRGLHKNSIAVIVNEFVHRLLITILLVLFGFKIISFDWFVILFALSYFLPASILIVYLVRINELKFKRSIYKLPFKFQRIFYSYSIFSYLNSLGTSIVLTMDAMMIASFLGLKETGIYTTILYLISAIQIPNKSILRVSSTMVAQYWKERNLGKMNELYKQVSSMSLLVALYLFLIVWINVDYIFSFLPSDFSTAIISMVIILIGKLIDVYFGLNGIIFITSKKYKYDMYFTIMLLVMVYCLNLYLIPSYGITGAAISTSLAIIIYNIMRLLVVWKIYDLHPFEINQLYFILLFLVIIFLNYFSPNLQLNKHLYFILKSGVASLLFLGVIIKFKWSKEIDYYVKKYFNCTV